MSNAARKYEGGNQFQQNVGALKLPAGMVPLSEADLTVSAPANRLAELSKLLETWPIAVTRNKQIDVRLREDTLTLSSASGLSDYQIGQWPGGVSRINGTITLYLDNATIKRVIIEERPIDLHPSQSHYTAPSRTSSPYVSENRGESGSYSRKGES